MSHRFDAVERVADAVLFEGYVLYPYRASALKNRYRWQFGVVAPRSPQSDGEPWFAQAECLVAPAVAHRGGRLPALLVRVRCLRPRAAAARPGDDRPWLEGVPLAIDADPIALDRLPLMAAVPLARFGVDARLTVEARGEAGLVIVRLRLENHEWWRPAFDADRDAMLCRSLVGAHLLLGVDGGRFESLLEPAAAAAPYAARCRSVHMWPVLAGDRTQQDTMLASPIVLYDFPAVARESRGDLFDAAEIDEILSLRILTMTPDERREARETDPRARAMLDRVEGMSPADLEALHGAMRSADFFNPPGTPAPEAASVTVGGRHVRRGSRVRLRPSRRADAMDVFLRGQSATVAGVYRDVDDRTYVAVTVDADPAAELHDAFGRFFYFDPDEVEPLDPAAGAGDRSARACG